MKNKVCKFIAEWVDLNLTSGSAITELEQLTGYSGKTLQRWFREYYNMTPGEYLHRRRMTRAAILLRMTALPVTEISDMFHYYSSQNFSRAFLGFTGLTPTEYRDHSEWFCESLQPSIQIDKSHYKDWSICTLPDTYIKGINFYGTDYVSLASSNNKIFLNIQNFVQELGRDGKVDVSLAGIAHKPSELHIGRKDAIELFLYVGHSVLPEEGYTICVPGGTYLRWRFSGTWSDYIVLSKAACIMLTSGTTIRRRVGYDYVHFLPVAALSPQTEVLCDMYIPVTLSENLRFQ